MTRRANTNFFSPFPLASSQGFKLEVKSCIPEGSSRTSSSCKFQCPRKVIASFRTSVQSLYNHSAFASRFFVLPCVCSSSQGSATASFSSEIAIIIYARSGFPSNYLLSRLRVVSSRSSVVSPDSEALTRSSARRSAVSSRVR